MLRGAQLLGLLQEPGRPGMVGKAMPNGTEGELGKRVGDLALNLLNPLEPRESQREIA